MWEVAESYLEELLSRNMIQPIGHVDDYAWKNQTYRVHDMLLEVMVSKSLEANFVSLQGRQYDKMLYEKIRRLSIHGDTKGVDSIDDGDARDLQCKDDLDVQHVRSLSMFQLHGHKLLKKLDNFILLRVLDLEDCVGVTNKYMRYACNLYLLRFLSLKGTNLSKVPRQIKNLEHLQTLDVDDTLLTGLPETITKLEKLEYIRFSNKDDYWDKIWSVPWGINKMKSLRVLRKVCLGNDSKVAQELGELEQLEELILSIDDRKTIAEDVLKELAVSLSKMHSLRWLSIGHLSDDDNGGKILSFLNDLPTPPRLLRTLWINGDVDGLPNWISSLTHLVTFTVQKTTLIDDQLFGILCKLPNLKSLCVSWDCYSNRDELVVRTSHKFLVLRDLILIGYLPKVLRFEEGSMSTLEKLELIFDYRSRDVAERSLVGIEQLTNLKKVMVEVNQVSPALSDAILEQLKAENSRPSMSNPFQIIVKYL